MKLAAFLLFLLSQPARAGFCPVLLQIISDEVGDAPFAVAVDYDDTVVDTGPFLVNSVLPAALRRAIALAEAPSAAVLESHLNKISARGLRSLPPLFDERTWKESDFPWAHLPAQLAQRPHLTETATPLVGFWDLMAEEFETQDRHGLKILPAFRAFFDALNAGYGTRVHWVVVTARHDAMAQDIPVVLQGLSGHAHPIEIVTRGPRSPLVAKDVGPRKGLQIENYLAPSGARVRIFVDNDGRNLQAARERLGSQVFLLHMLREWGSADPALRVWP